MGKNITEKILARAAGRAEVSPGDYIEVSSRCPLTMSYSLGRGMDEIERLGAKVFNPKLVNVVDGHNGSTASHKAAETRKAVRQWAKGQGIPDENIYELGRQGIEHVVAAEHAWALPGECFFQKVNGHTTTLGALGAFAITLSYGSSAYLITGKTWLKVPQSVKIIVKGQLPKGVYERDIFEYVLGRMGPSGAVGAVMEWAGPTIDEMTMDGRFTLCSLALFTGAWTAIVNPDQKVLDYVKARTEEPFEPLVSDADAQYAEVFEFDVSQLAPQVVPPPERYHVKPVTEVAGMKVNRGFIGSCADSRIADIRIAAGILKDKKLPPDVILNITHGSVEVYKQSAREALVEILLDAGCVLPSPACGMCFGANTPLVAGDICVSTGTCNYPGRMGSRDAEIYLGSPAFVAASCVEGKMADPRQYII
jgi:3-isopropylmalate/(R)-2-methylmalate dehydratase large subunit